MLRQEEVALANGKRTPESCQEAGITQQTYYRWRKEYGGLKLEKGKRFKELENENTRLKRLIAEPSLEKQILQDVARGKLVSPARRRLAVAGSGETTRSRSGTRAGCCSIGAGHSATCRRCATTQAEGGQGWGGARLAARRAQVLRRQKPRGRL